MNIVLWIVQVLVAAGYLFFGWNKAFNPAVVRANPQMTWTKDRPDAFIRFVGASEVLGGLGMILPLLTGILPWLTVAAAIGLSVIQVLAMFGEHLPRKEYQVLPINAALFAMTAFIAFGRWDLLSF